MNESFSELFSNFSIQTTTRCNRKCEFCPNSQKEFLQQGQMSLLTFNKIVEELNELNFKGRISPYLNAEPLMDKRLSKFIEILRETCQYSYLMINTNGDLLNVENTKELFASGLNCITINCYDSSNQFKTLLDSLEGLKEIKILESYPIDKEYEIHSYKSKFIVVRDCSHYRLDTKILTSRAGFLKRNIKIDFPLKRSCVRPSNHLCINFKGEIVLCCEDWLFKSVMGRIHDDKLLHIWNNKKFNQYRKYLARKDRSLLCCNKCDL